MFALKFLLPVLTLATSVLGEYVKTGQSVMLRYNDQVELVGTRWAGAIMGQAYNGRPYVYLKADEEDGQKFPIKVDPGQDTIEYFMAKGVATGPMMVDGRDVDAYILWREFLFRSINPAHPGLLFCVSGSNIQIKGSRVDEMIRLKSLEQKLIRRTLILLHTPIPLSSFILVRMTSGPQPILPRP